MDQKKIYSKKDIGSLTLETLANSENYNNWIVSKIKPFLGELNLEIGAGQGTISEAIAKDHQLIVSDIAPYNIQVLKKKFKKNKNVKGILADFSFCKVKVDCIYSSNVLEHIEDDFQVISKSLQILKKGGYFVAIVPAMNLLYSDFDKSIGHQRRYGLSDKKRIEDKLKKEKIKAKFITFDLFNPVGALGWLLKMRILKQKNIKLEDAKIVNTLVPYLKLIDNIKLPFGQSLIFVIKKEG